MQPTPVIVYEKTQSEESPWEDIPDTDNLLYHGKLIEIVTIANYVKCVIRRDDTGFIDVVDSRFVRDSWYAGQPV